MSPAYISAPTIERSKRCQNCIHFDNGPKAQQVYFVKRSREIEFKARQNLEKEGISLAGRSFDAKRALKLIERHDEGMIRLQRGTMGLCSKDRMAGDFVEYRALCDAWEQKYAPEGVEKGDVISADTRAAVFGADDPEQTQGSALKPEERAPGTTTTQTIDEEDGIE